MMDCRRPTKAEVVVPLRGAFIELIDDSFVSLFDQRCDDFGLRDCVTTCQSAQGKVRRDIDPDVDALVIAFLLEATTAIGLPLRSGPGTAWRGE